MDNGRLRRLPVVASLALLAAFAAVFSGDGPASAAGPGVIERVGDGGEGGIAISADGRFVAFTNEGTGAVTLFDRKTDSAQVLDFSSDWGTIDISADGRYVIFDAGSGVYLYDREQDSYEFLSGGYGWYDNIAISADGRFILAGGLVHDRLLDTSAEVGPSAGAASMSADGRFVAFDGGGVSVHDRDTDEDGIYDEPEAVETVVLAQGKWPAISDDGRFVAYFGGSVILHDRQTGASTTVAEAARGSGAAMELSADGRYLAFASEQPLVPEDTNGLIDVYLYDRLAGTHQLLSVAKDGTLANGNSAWGVPGESLAMIALSADGHYAAFHSGATNLVPGEGAGVFVARTSVSSDVDTDGDGCLDTQELAAQASLGGQRSLYNFWDFFDVPAGTPAERDRMVNIIDIAATVSRFGSFRHPPPTKDEALAEALMPPPPAPTYHAAYERGGPTPGQDLWDLLPPDGSLNIVDIGAVVAQFGHSCVEPQ